QSSDASAIYTLSLHDALPIYGTPLPAKPGEYRDVNGNLAAFRSLKPKYDATEYRDLELFLPYDEFKLAKGRHDLKMDVDLLDGEDRKSTRLNSSHVKISYAVF